MDDAGRDFLASLDDEARALCTFNFTEDERTAWTYLPGDRKGLMIGDLSSESRACLTLLMQSALSSSGYLKAEGVIMLEEVLRELQPNAGRDPGKYAITVFGNPGEGAWAWSLEGHHLSLNFTVDGESSRSTPLMFGVAPAIVKDGPRAGLRVLGAELDAARVLINSLTKEQRRAAELTTDRPGDVVMTPARSKPLGAAGLKGSALNEEQQNMLFHLISEYTGNIKPSASQREMLRSLNPTAYGSPGEVMFAYKGETDSGLLYYRVTSGNISFEYAAIANDPNHAHALWRDLDQDFGADILGEHLKEQH